MNELMARIAENNRYFTNTSPFRINYTENNPKICIVNGQNSSGKSLLRKILNVNYRSDNVTFVNYSLEDRTTSGIKRAVIYGTEDYDSSGYNSVRIVLNTIKNYKNSDKPFAVMFDEPEIGCSEELCYSLSKRIVDAFPEFEKNDSMKCMYIITHSRVIAKTLSVLNPSNAFLYQEGNNPITLNDWINREIEEIDIDEMIKNSHENYRKIQNIIDKK